MKGTLSKFTGERWLMILQALDRMVRKHDYHWGNLPAPEDWIEHGMPGPPLYDEDFHRLFEYMEQSIRQDVYEDLPEIYLKAHEYTKGEHP